MRRLGIATIIALASCFAPGADSAGDASDTEYIPDDVPSGNCGETDNDACESTGTGAADGCVSTDQCADGLFCIASFDGEIGRFDCSLSCIADLDESRWCLDDASCCSEGSVCQGRGYCVPAGAMTTGVDPDTGIDTGTDTGAADGTSSVGDTGTTDTGTGDSGTTGAAIEPDARPIGR